MLEKINLQTKFTLLFILQNQLMEDGRIGLSGLHVMHTVAQEVVTEAECVTTHHQKMVGRSVLVTAINLRTARERIVIVSLLAKVL